MLRKLHLCEIYHGKICQETIYRKVRSGGRGIKIKLSGFEQARQLQEQCQDSIESNEEEVKEVTLSRYEVLAGDVEALAIVAYNLIVYRP